MVNDVSFLSSLSKDKGENLEPHGVSQINIAAHNGSNIAAPMLFNSTVTGNINISNNYFPGEWRYPSMLVETPQPNTTILNL